MEASLDMEQILTIIRYRIRTRNFFVGSLLLIVLVFCVVVNCFVCLGPVSFVPNVACVWIFHLWLPLQISLTFIYTFSNLGCGYDG
jgi:hypothetical protein